MLRRIALVVAFSSIAALALAAERPAPAPPVDTEKAKPVEVCSAPKPGGDPSVTCCCSTGNGGVCCGEMAYCSGGFVVGCGCR